MVRTYLAFGGVTIAALGLTMITNCSSTTGTGTGGAAVTGLPHEEPPDAGPPTPPDGTANVTLAISKLYLGDTDPDGTPDLADGWKYYGYDLDGQISTATSTNLCQPADGASKAQVYPDGNEGIDNSFGKLILPILLGVASGASSEINGDIAAGKFTILLEMKNLGSGADYNPLFTNLFAGGDLGSTPMWNGNDQWPVLPGLLNDPTNIDAGSKVSFPQSYVTNNTWVSGSKGDVTLTLSIAGHSIDLAIVNAVLSVVLDPSHRTGSRGVIAGVLNTAAFTSQIQGLAGSISPTLCSGATIETVLDDITKASDILHDGTQDPTKVCDGISIGLGFDAELVQLGPIAPAPPVVPNPCGTGGGSGTGGSGGGGGTDGGTDGG